MWFPFPRIPPSGCPATKEVYLSPHHTCICISPACEQYTIIIQRSTYKNYASYAMYIVHGYRRHYLRTSLHKVVEAQATGNNNINIRRIYKPRVSEIVMESIHCRLKGLCERRKNSTHTSCVQPRIWGSVGV